MRRISRGQMYLHRGAWIFRTPSKDGWYIDTGCMYVFPTLEDARQYINKIFDGTNTREPRILREWNIEQDYRKEEANGNESTDPGSGQV